jgi:predicted amidohydrolase
VYDTIKVAALSIMSKKWNKPANADKLEDFFVRAAREDARLIVAPEGALEGYVVYTVCEYPRRAPEMLEIAEPIDGPYVKRFQRLAKQLHTCLCFGMAERIGDDIYNSAVVIGDDGAICGTYHKTQFAEGYHPSWSFNRIGTTLRAIDTPIGRVGIVICNDRWNPLIARTLVLDGARVILIPSFGSKDKKQNVAVLARARENGVPIVNANVGMNLIISKGEIIAYKWGNDQITTGVVDLPIWPSTEAARASEMLYLEQQGPEMARRYETTVAEFADKHQKEAKKRAATLIALPDENGVTVLGCRGVGGFEELDGPGADDAGGVVDVAPED